MMFAAGTASNPESTPWADARATETATRAQAVIAALPGARIMDARQGVDMVRNGGSLRSTVARAIAPDARSCAQELLGLSLEPRHLASSEGGHRVHRLDAAAKGVLCEILFSGCGERLTEQEQALGVVRPVRRVLLEGPARIGPRGRGDVGRSDLAPDLVAAVRLVLPDDFLEPANGLLESPLVARDPAELVVRVDLARIDLHRLLEACLGLLELSPLLMKETEVVVGLGVARVQRRRLQVPLEALPSSEDPRHVRHLALEVLPATESQERSRQERSDGQEEQAESPEERDGNGPPRTYTHDRAHGEDHERGEHEEAHEKQEEPVPRRQAGHGQAQDSEREVGRRPGEKSAGEQSSVVAAKGHPEAAHRREHGRGEEARGKVKSRERSQREEDPAEHAPENGARQQDGEVG